MSTNRDYAWMLRDEEGNQLGSNPEGEQVEQSYTASLTLGADTVLNLGTITASNTSTWSIGNNGPLENRGWRTTSPYGERRENIEHHLTLDMRSYRRRNGREPEHLIINTNVYRHLCTEIGETNLVSFRGVRVICTQALAESWVFVGSPADEAFGR